MSIQDKNENQLKALDKNVNPYIFTEETISSLQELGGVLKKIHYRLVSEGYTFEGNKIIPPQNKYDTHVPK
ncbi:MAG: hypothetical protein ABI763_10895 [Bacteroidota bacterium]